MIFSSIFDDFICQAFGNVVSSSNVKLTEKKTSKIVDFVSNTFSKLETRFFSLHSVFSMPECKKQVKS